MKKGRFGIFLSLLLIFTTVLTAGCAASVSVTGVTTDVSATEAHTLIQNNGDNPDFVVLDVRTPQEYAEGHLSGAINKDFYKGDFRNELDDMDKSKAYLVYCRSGNRSQSSVDMMEGLGFTKIYHMTGGIIEWNTEGLPVEK